MYSAMLTYCGVQQPPAHPAFTCCCIVSCTTNQWQLCLISNQTFCSGLIISQQAQNTLIINGIYLEMHVFQWEIHIWLLKQY